ncbi:MAG: DUF6180 family protein [Rhizobiaceae bacterium]
MRLLIASTLVAFGFAPSLAQAASDQFNVAYNVERVDASRLSRDKCADIAQREADGNGYVHSVDRTPGKLAVVSGGLAQGGASLLVYCIAVDDHTAYVVQGIDYQPEKGNAGALADRIHEALVEASK